MASYLDLKAFTALSIAPEELIAQVETTQNGWVTSQLEAWSAWIDAKLAKRYATPFASPSPIAVRFWLARIMTAAVYLKRGVDPTDAQSAAILADAEAARAEVQEAADSKEGRYELPLRADTTAQGISKGAPLGYSEQTPYAWVDRQADAAFDEWESREGA